MPKRKSPPEGLHVAEPVHGQKLTVDRVGELSVEKVGELSVDSDYARQRRSAALARACY
jgi:hypothetical protein